MDSEFDFQYDNPNDPASIKKICFDENTVALVIFFTLYGTTLIVIIANLCKDYVLKPLNLFNNKGRNQLVNRHQKEIEKGDHDKDKDLWLESEDT